MAAKKRKQQQEELAELLADVPEHCQVLLLGEKIDKRGKFYKACLKLRRWWNASLSNPIS